MPPLPPSLSIIVRPDVRSSPRPVCPVPRLDPTKWSLVPAFQKAEYIEADPTCVHCPRVSVWAWASVGIRRGARRTLRMKEINFGPLIMTLTLPEYVGAVNMSGKQDDQAAGVSFPPNLSHEMFPQHRPNPAGEGLRHIVGPDLAQPPHRV